MAKKVKLSEVMDAFEMAMESVTYYLDTETCEVVMISADGYGGDEDEELAEKISEDTTDRYLELPSKFEVHDWDIMKRFVMSLNNANHVSELDNAIRGRGAFRMFRATADRLGLLNDWYDFQHESYKEMAKEWCENHKVDWTDDIKRKKAK